MPVILEYIWIGGNGELRTKTRVVDNVNEITDWNYDGSSLLDKHHLQITLKLY